MFNPTFSYYFHQINFDENKKAVSVVYERNGKVHQARARKEIILSAGAYNSPKILMLSGVGPKKELNKHNIQIISDLPGVGENLNDHPQTYLYFTMEKIPSLVYTEPQGYIDGAESFVANRTGGFATLSGRVQGNFRTKYALDDRPDVSLIASTGLPNAFVSNFLHGKC